MLVAYAGKETERGPNARQTRAYAKFMAGKDTADIAEFYHINESTALRWISLERCHLLGLPSPYRA